MKRQLETQRSAIKIEEIAAKEFGNPLIARGAFGEISIAIQLPTAAKSSSDDISSSSSNNNNNNNDHEIENLLHPSKARFVALKTIHNAVIFNNEKSSHEFTPAVVAELEALRALSPHENIVPLLSIQYQREHGGHNSNPPEQFFTSESLSSLSSSSLSFVFPYCPADLQEIISYRRRSKTNNDGRHQDFTKPMIQTIMKDITTGLDYCHSKGILHCDIKPGNIVLSSNGVFQLADFGLAKQYECVSNENDKQVTNLQKESNQDQHGLCTLYYRPPELLYGSTLYEPSIDMWGLGLVLTELCTLRPLFPGCSVLDQLSRIMDVLGTPTTESYPMIHILPDYGKVKFDTRCGVGLKMVVPCMEVDLDLADFIENLIVMNPEKRLTTKKCLMHPWLNDEKKTGFKGTRNNPIMLQNLIFNSDVLDNDGDDDDDGGDDSVNRRSLPRVSCNDFNADNILNDMLLEQMKLKGIAMAEARRKLSSYHTFHLQKSERENKARTNKGLAKLLAEKIIKE